MANVKVIPPREKAPDILRVAAYCRVSSDSADQKHSYATQIRAYTEKIGGHEGWELVDVYADEGLTGVPGWSNGRISTVCCRTAGRARSTRCW